MLTPSYNLCAICIVFLALKPSFRDASCCRVDVINAGAGLRFTVFLLSDETKYFCSNRLSRIVSACSAFFIENFSNFFPSKVLNFALKILFSLFSNFASIVQNCSAWNASISASRSTTILRATDCTRPADLLPGSFLHKMGDRVKPTR